MFQKNKLDFSDFFHTTRKDWRENILKELKSNSDEILQKNAETLKIKGFYTFEEVQKLKYLKGFHNHFILKSPRHWYTLEYIEFTTLETTSRSVTNALKSGADGLHFELENACIREQEISTLVDNSQSGFAWCLFSTEEPLYELVKTLQNVDNSKLKGMLLNPSYPQKPSLIEGLILQQMQAFKQLRNIPNLKSIGIAFTTSNPSQSIAIAISHAIEIIDKLTQEGFELKEVLGDIGFSVPLGKNFFVEIAKLRALRLVWHLICQEYDPSFDGFSTPIHCQTSSNSFTDDPNYNILINTTQAMSAIIGGCDALTIIPSDKGIKSANGFSSRIARNISILLKEEAHLNFTADPAGGSFMIDSLTDQIAQEVLEKIKLIEINRGLINYLQEGNAL